MAAEVFQVGEVVGVELVLEAVELVALVPEMVLVRKVVGGQSHIVESSKRNSIRQQLLLLEPTLALQSKLAVSFF